MACPRFLGHGGRPQVRQAAAFAENLVLTRKIEMNIGESTFQIHDSIRNEGYVEEPIQVMYHFNLGWPLLAPGAQVTSSCTVLLASTDGAKNDQHQTMPGPTPKDTDHVWDWNASRGEQRAQLVSEDFAE